MDKIARIAGTAAPLTVDNITTDIISPGELYKTVKADFARGLFAPWRYRADGSDNPAFVLNTPRFRNARVLVAGKNFACGSSREIAVWCLQRYGIGCVIAPSFGEIFFENAFKSGLVAIEMAEHDVKTLSGELGMQDVEPHVTVDLEKCVIATPRGNRLSFEMDATRRMAFLEGLDELSMILREDAAIQAFQDEFRRSHPWLAPEKMS